MSRKVTAGFMIILIGSVALPTLILLGRALWVVIKRYWEIAIGIN